MPNYDFSSYFYLFRLQFFPLAPNELHSFRLFISDFSVVCTRIHGAPLRMGHSTVVAFIRVFYHNNNLVFPWKQPRVHFGLVKYCLQSRNRHLLYHLLPFRLFRCADVDHIIHFSCLRYIENIKERSTPHDIIIIFHIWKLWWNVNGMRHETSRNNQNNNDCCGFAFSFLNERCSIKMRNISTATAATASRTTLAHMKNEMHVSCKNVIRSANTWSFNDFMREILPIWEE